MNESQRFVPKKTGAELLQYVHKQALVVELLLRATEGGNHEAIQEKLSRYHAYKAHFSSGEVVDAVVDYYASIERLVDKSSEIRSFVLACLALGRHVATYYPQPRTSMIFLDTFLKADHTEQFAELLPELQQFSVENKSFYVREAAKHLSSFLRG